MLQPAPPSVRLSPRLERLAAESAAAAERAAAAAAAGGLLGVLSAPAYAAATAAKKAAGAAATAAAAEIAAGPLQQAAAPVLCITDYGRRPLLFLSSEDLSELKKHMQHFYTLMREFKRSAKVNNAGV